MLKISFGDYYSITFYAFSFVYVDYITCQTNKNLVFGNKELVKIDTAINHTFKADENNRSLQSHGMRKKTQVSKIVQHHNVFVITHKLGDVLLQKALY
ncbi:hypothetical protein [uncultured Bacteroides sp.]|uniref:hypothetical protein n=1 Tax=uncultured Bacteroides sp. TaxID=162156 RepID=UPI0026215CD0|nr:hypothetical protein [uncultured Bacteroides sp.]